MLLSLENWKRKHGKSWNPETIPKNPIYLRYLLKNFELMFSPHPAEIDFKKISSTYVISFSTFCL